MTEWYVEIHCCYILVSQKKRGPFAKILILLIDVIALQSQTSLGTKLV